MGRIVYSIYVPEDPRFIKPNAMGQDLKSRVGLVLLIRYTELGAYIIRPGSRLITDECEVCEVAPLLCKIPSKRCCFEICCWDIDVENPIAC